MELVVQLVHIDHRDMFELLAATGVRRSELLAFEGRHLHLDGEHPYVSVRQRVRRQRGKGLVLGSPRSRHSRRDLPIPVDLAERVLRPACEEAGVSWAGFHTFRYTVASRLFDGGRNVVQVQRWLGHHSPSFTLDYTSTCSRTT